MALGSSLGPDDMLAVGVSTGHLDQGGSSNDMDLQTLTRPYIMAPTLAFQVPLVAT